MKRKAAKKEKTEKPKEQEKDEKEEEEVKEEEKEEEEKEEPSYDFEEDDDVVEEDDGGDYEEEEEAVGSGRKKKKRGRAAAEQDAFVWSVARMTPLLHVPADLARAAIASHLSVADLFSLAAVSRYCRHIAEPVLQRHAVATVGAADVVGVKRYLAEVGHV